MTKMKKMNLQENHPVAKERAQGRGRTACSFAVMITFNITHSKYMCITFNICACSYRLALYTTRVLVSTTNYYTVLLCFQMIACFCDDLF